MLQTTAELMASSARPTSQKYSSPYLYARSLIIYHLLFQSRFRSTNRSIGTNVSSKKTNVLDSELETHQMARSPSVSEGTSLPSLSIIVTGMPGRGRPVNPRLIRLPTRFPHTKVVSACPYPSRISILLICFHVVMAAQFRGSPVQTQCFRLIRRCHRAVLLEYNLIFG